MKNWRGVAFTAALASVCQPLYAASATAPGDESIATATTFKFVDARPSEQKAMGNSQLSYWITSCSYGIHRLGDAKGSPRKLDLLRADLEKSLGGTLNDKTLTVSSYALYLNSGSVMRGTALFAGFGAIGGLLGAFLKPEMGSRCSREDTPEGWYSASEVSSNASPLIVQLTATLDGKSYSVRVVQTPSDDALTPSDDPVHAYAPILHRANQALADKIAGRWGSSPDEPVLAFAPATAAAKSYASMLPLGIGTAGSVNASSLTAAYFDQDPHGVAIGTLEADGSAARAGIRPGDVITEIDGERVDAVVDLQSSVARASRAVNVQLNRSGKLLAVQVHL